MAPARRADRSASSTPWDRSTSSRSRSPRNSPASTTSAAPTPIRISRMGVGAADVVDAGEFLGDRLRRYKQNTHGGGIRDPFILSWPQRIAAQGELRHQFVHASDLVPTLLDLIGIAAPATIAGVPQMPLEGVSFAASIADATAPSK